VAGEIDPVRVVDDAIEDGVGIGGLPEHRRMPQLLTG
jgi:hypothetical protein